MLNHAAKAQQADFVVMMTGTPVENSTMDVWTLLDVAWPGLLGVSGKEFVDRYGDGTDEALMEELKTQLTEQQKIGDRKVPPVMLRRFKSDILTLPPKTERIWIEDMPAEQAGRYDKLIDEARAGELTGFAFVQAVRSICLHPTPALRPPKNEAERKALIAGSARFQALFKILHEARNRNRAVLVFVDIRAAQSALRYAIRDEFGLPRLPEIINGNTDVRAVDEIVETFQRGTGFDVLLLGPRSAGFGLTLTRATEVVHLNRWWNPAVEDQCSDRTHRKGQDREVTVHLPIARHPRLGDGSFDLILAAMLQRKRSLSRKVVVPSSMSSSELAELFARLAAGGKTEGFDTLLDLDRKDWLSFEMWVAEQFRTVGWQVNDTPRSNDGGGDVIARHPAGGRPIIVQVKHRALGRGTVNHDAVEQVLNARGRYQRSHPWLTDPILFAVSNGKFELRACTLAEQRQVRIVGRDEILALKAFAREGLSVAR